MSQNPYEQNLYGQDPSNPKYPGIPETSYGSGNAPPPPPVPNPYDPNTPTVVSHSQTSDPGYPSYPSYDPNPQAGTMSAPPSRPPQKADTRRNVLIAVIALVVIAGGILGFVGYNSNQNSIRTNTTATAQAQARANATVVANATVAVQATATAGPIATATALATSPYPSYSTLALSDPLSTNGPGGWQADSNCKFTGGSYQISLAQQGYFQGCFAQSNTFDDFAYQVNMTIPVGDCGGLIFRSSGIDFNAAGFYEFEVCQNGTYNLYIYPPNNGQAVSLIKSTTSSNIHQGLKQTNLLAVVVEGNSISMYVNDRTTPIATMTDPHSTFSKGYVGVFADASNNPTTATFTDAFVWTH